VQELIALQVQLEAFSQEAPEVVQLHIACNCVDDQSVSSLQLDLALCHFAIL
jgi:hypothetical protein